MRLIKNKLFVTLTSFLIVVISSSLLAQSSIEFKDEIFKSFVKTIRLYPRFNTVDQDLQAPIVSLSSSTGLILEFDILLEDYEPFQAKLIHCNANWTRSMLSDIEILADYNSFDLNDFKYSENTNTLYTQYIF